jgi:ribonuclease HI
LTRGKAQTGDLVAIYADESCLGNGRDGDNPGGAGGVIEWLHPKSNKVERFDYWISDPGTTNNRMALRSVIEAFREISRRGNTYKVLFTSDSKYIVEGMKSWVGPWIERGWKRKGGAIENLELWKEAVAVVSPHEVDFRWVAGHAGHPQNEYANHLATRAAAELSNSGGLRQSEYETWVEKQKGTRVRLNEPSPFPDPQSFRPMKRTWTI